MSPKKACQFIVGLLKLAADKNCETPLGQDVLMCIQEQKPLNLDALKKRYGVMIATSDDVLQIEVKQHGLSDYNDLLTGEVA